MHTILVFSLFFYHLRLCFQTGFIAVIYCSVQRRARGEHETFFFLIYLGIIKRFSIIDYEALSSKTVSPPALPTPLQAVLGAFLASHVSGDISHYFIVSHPPTGLSICGSGDPI